MVKLNIFSFLDGHLQYSQVKELAVTIASGDVKIEKIVKII
jgi:hypothetical protein